MTREWRGGEFVELTLPVRPRLTVADPRVDDARGCIAVERGPLVYCAEQTDQKADLPDLVLTGTPRDADILELDGYALPTVQIDAAVRTDDAPAAWPYRTLSPAEEGDPADGGGREPATVTAIPYFAWANREYGAMRLWLPHDAAH